jgi:hypothetical protein
MCSLFAGNRRGFLAYKESCLSVGDTFYIAVLWSNRRLIKSTIVEIVTKTREYVILYDTKENGYYRRTVGDFLRIANNDIDLYGGANPMI